MTDIETRAREKQDRPDGCVSAAIAALLGIPLASVPRFDEEANPGKNQNGVVRSWLATQGLGLAVTIAPGPLKYHCRYIACGPAERGHHHVCVYDRGDLEFDPHESDDGLIDIDECWLVYPLGTGLPGIKLGLEQAAEIALAQQYGNIAHDAETECHDASCQQIASAIRALEAP